MTSNMKVVGGVIVSTLFVVIFAKRPSGEIKQFFDI